MFTLVPANATLSDSVNPHQGEPRAESAERGEAESTGGEGQRAPTHAVKERRSMCLRAAD